MDNSEIGARLRRLEDHQQLRDLVARYALHVDDHDFEALSTLWAPDARYLWKGSADVTVGAEKVTALLKSRIELAGPSYHVNHDHVIEFGDDPNRATGLVCGHAETSSAASHNIAAIRYHDSYVRHDGRWKFQERALAFLYLTPVSDYLDVLRTRERIRLSKNNTLGAHWPEFYR